MYPKQSLHTHTVFSDGKNTPREMIEAAISLGLKVIGFTDHSYTFFDEGYCLSKEQIPVYRETILSLKEEYRGKIDVRLGIEQDYDSHLPAKGYEYVIGSVHYVKINEPDARFITVDESPALAADILRNAARDYFDGDIYRLIEAYFCSVADVVRKTGADIIGHFNVVAKCNTCYPIFEENHPRYVSAWKAAADKLLLTGKPFEINVSPVLRGIRKEPYPSAEMQEYIRAKGGNFILTGDCHSTQELEKFVKFSFEQND